MTKRITKPKNLQYPLQNAVIDSIQDKKGENITVLDLSKINDSITDNFIICHADNTTQVRAIGNNVIDHVFEQTGERPFSNEGFGTCEWIIIDFISIVVHVFLKDKRYFYDLEELWSDAKKTEIANL